MLCRIVEPARDEWRQRAVESRGWRAGAGGLEFVEEWFEKLPDILRAGEAAVLVTVVASKGSAPREAGTKMLVWRDGFAGTIGGGNLEYGATGSARDALSESGAAWWLQDLPLGPSLGQCCGGRVTLLYERVGAADLAWAVPLAERLGRGERLVLATRLRDGAGTEKSILAAEPPAALPPDPAAGPPDEARPRLVPQGDSRSLLEPLHRRTQPLYLFGAGHVGRAIVRAFADLPFAITWIDARPEMFPSEMLLASRPRALRRSLEGAPAPLVAGAPPDTFYLVMTHSHDTDFEICEQVLRRGDFGFLGLIGSGSKKARCLKRLEARGFPPADRARLTCPIGLDGIASKVPAAIAVGVAAQLLRLSEQNSLKSNKELPDSNLDLTGSG